MPHHAASIVASSARESSIPAAWPGAFCPNFSDWAAGDIVVVHRHQGLAGFLLQAGQFLSTKPLTALGSHMTHVGIYVGNGMMVDATLGRSIGEVSVWSYCQSRSVQVRRIVDPAITPAQIADIAVKARAHVGEPYSTLALIASKLWPGTRPQRKSLYCSTFVGLVIADATGVDLSSSPDHQPLYPATLGMHPDLTDVPVEWRSL